MCVFSQGRRRRRRRVGMMGIVGGDGGRGVRAGEWSLGCAARTRGDEGRRGRVIPGLDDIAYISTRPSVQPVHLAGLS